MLMFSCYFAGSGHTCERGANLVRKSASMMIRAYCSKQQVRDRVSNMQYLYLQRYALSVSVLDDASAA